MARKAPLNWGVKDMPMPKEKNWPGASGRRVEKVERRVRKMEKDFGRIAKEVDKIAKGGNLKAVVDALVDIAKAIREPIFPNGGATEAELKSLLDKVTAILTRLETADAQVPQKERKNHGLQKGSQESPKTS